MSDGVAMTELLPCSKCRRVPNGVLHATDMCGFSFECDCGLRSVGPYMSHAADTWNRVHGAPLTLAERPQDEPCVDEPSVGDGVREIVPTCDGKRWRDCGDALARWSVMACSGGG